MKHIYWFAPYHLNCPSTRYRAKYALQELEKAYGVSYDFVYPSYTLTNILLFLRIYFSILFFRKENSLVVYQKIHTNRFYSRALKLLLLLNNENTLFDLDDAEYERHPAEPLNYFIKNCSACSVGSDTLMDYCKKLNSSVFKVTSPIINHEKQKAKRNEILTIGWIGFYNSHKENMEKLLYPALEEIGFEVKLVLLGVDRQEQRKEVKSYFSQFEHITLQVPENIDWQNESSIYEMISRFDIGVAPLLDTEMCRAKSAFKQKQYLSCGVPVLASPIGENTLYLRHGVDGFLCSTPAEFKKGIETIRNMDDKSYAAMSKAARGSIENYTMSLYCETVVNYCTSNLLTPNNQDVNLYPTPRTE